MPWSGLLSAMGNGEPVGFPVAVQLERPSWSSRRDRFVQQHHAAANRVLVAEFIAGVGLQSAGIEIPLHVAGHAVEIKVADGVGQ